MREENGTHGHITQINMVNILVYITSHLFVFTCAHINILKMELYNSYYLHPILVLNSEYSYLLINVSQQQFFS